MTQQEYLNELPQKTREALEFGKKRRIEFVKKPKFIKHPKALRLFKKLTDLMDEPKRTGYAPCSS